MKSRPWPDIWMLPTRSNIDTSLALVWEKDPDAVFYTDLMTRAPIVKTRHLGVERVVPFMPGFVWSNTPERTGKDLVEALKL